MMKENLDFAKTEKRAKEMTVAMLEFAIIDCRNAISAYPDGQKANYYADEMGVYSKELGGRRKKVTKTNDLLSIAEIQVELIRDNLGQGTNAYKNAVMMVQLIKGMK